MYSTPITRACVNSFHFIRNTLHACASKTKKKIYRLPKTYSNFISNISMSPKGSKSNKDSEKMTLGALKEHNLFIPFKQIELIKKSNSAQDHTKECSSENDCNKAHLHSFNTGEMNKSGICYPLTSEWISLCIDHTKKGLNTDSILHQMIFVRKHKEALASTNYSYYESSRPGREINLFNHIKSQRSVCPYLDMSFFNGPPSNLLRNFTKEHNEDIKITEINNKKELTEKKINVSGNKNSVLVYNTSDESEFDYLKWFIENNEDKNFGVALKLWNDKKDAGHAVGIHINSQEGIYQFFDPNLGIFKFETVNALMQGIATIHADHFSPLGYSLNEATFSKPTQ